MRLIYAIDACALIDANKLYNRKVEMFVPLWDKLEEMFENRQLVSSSEIYDELKDQDLLNWIKPFKSAFLPLDDEIQGNVVDVLSKFPGLINLKKGKKGNSNGDPFLIATALQNKAIIVTNERLSPPESSIIKIPNVCQSLGIESINLTEFIERIMVTP